ncbi:2OG-Fe(II) oxygenase [Porphyrobacter sp. YT40]|uniref:2OG-Fe(II) oxygenase n=1 Tax=Porphyrobacter sp. YT40 TaxID=2547601 RepID=UPI0011411E81|nr:2OG-Fe(II) oxygenase [Porphyrobacter sp. YT40]QDH34430.1 2OG-Fe(II) oxygenase [Porphyrobacter sp. YT40]
MLLPVCIIDDFLGPEVSARMREFVIGHEAEFEPSAQYHYGGSRSLEGFRKSLSFRGDPEPVLEPFAAGLKEVAARLRAETGCESFGLELSDFDLTAYRDGHRLKRHIDTHTGPKRALSASDRVLSLVYYLMAEPRAFSGGDLVMYGLVGDERRTITPQHDRLVAFPSLAPHEVEPIHLPGDDFATARFSLVCWLCRPRPDNPAAA